MLAIFVQRDDLHRDVPGDGILFYLTQHRPAKHIGQENIERNGGGAVLRTRFSASTPRIATSTLNPEDGPVPSASGNDVGSSSTINIVVSSVSRLSRSSGTTQSSASGIRTEGAALRFPRRAFRWPACSWE